MFFVLKSVIVINANLINYVVIKLYRIFLKKVKIYIHKETMIRNIMLTSYNIR